MNLSRQTVDYLIRITEIGYDFGPRARQALAELRVLQTEMLAAAARPLLFTVGPHPTRPVDIWRLGYADSPTTLEAAPGSEISFGLSALLIAAANNGESVRLDALDSARSPARWALAVSRARRELLRMTPVLYVALNRERVHISSDATIRYTPLPGDPPLLLKN